MAWLIVSLTAVSNAAIDLGRVGSVATATSDDDGEGDTLWLEEKSALKLVSCSSRCFILSAILEDDCSRRSEILRVAWLRLSAAGH